MPLLPLLGTLLLGGPAILPSITLSRSALVVGAWRVLDCTVAPAARSLLRGGCKRLRPPLLLLLLPTLAPLACCLSLVLLGRLSVALTLTSSTVKGLSVGLLMLTTPDRRRVNLLTDRAACKITQHMRQQLHSGAGFACNIIINCIVACTDNTTHSHRLCAERWKSTHTNAPQPRTVWWHSHCTSH